MAKKTKTSFLITGLAVIAIGSSAGAYYFFNQSQISADTFDTPPIPGSTVNSSLQTLPPVPSTPISSAYTPTTGYATTQTDPYSSTLGDDSYSQPSSSVTGSSNSSSLTNQATDNASSQDASTQNDLSQINNDQLTVPERGTSTSSNSSPDQSNAIILAAVAVGALFILGLVLFRKKKKNGLENITQAVPGQAPSQPSQPVEPVMPTQPIQPLQTPPPATAPLPQEPNQNQTPPPAQPPTQ